MLPALRVPPLGVDCAAMEFLSAIERASGLGRGFLAVVLGAMVLTLVLRRVHAEAQPRLRLANLLQLAGLSGLLGCAALLTSDVDGQSFMFRILRDASDVLLALSVVTVLAVIVFDYVLEPLRMRPPAIVIELILGAAYVATLVVVLQELGRDLSGVITTSAIATAAIGFALQDTLRSVLGGMSLQIDRSVGVGDWIRVDAFEGRVSEIRWRQTSIVTRDGDTVVIPNSHLSTAPVTVLGKHGRRAIKRRRWIPFEIDHSEAAGEVMRAVETALRGNPVPGAAQDPVPDCVLTDLRGASQALAARYWLEDLREETAADSAVRTRIIAALQRIGVSFSFPTQDVRLYPKDAEHLRMDEEREIARKLDALSQIAIFAPLTDEERSSVAARLIETKFSAGETITHQGAAANWLYVVTRGAASVRVAGEHGGPDKVVATLEPGGFFGEMALLTGAPRSATVSAQTDVVCYKLDKESFLDTIQSRPSMAEEISRILAQRRVELDAVREDLNEEAKRLRLAAAQRDLLGRIRKFFRLH